MCIAIVKTKDATISEETLRNCWESNPDGAGFAYPNNGAVTIEKGFFKFKNFLKRYKEVEKEHPHTPMLIHFRISTSGNIDKNNCHPHRITSNLVMIHNGVLHIDVPKDSKVSDTILYCRNYLQKLPNGFEHNDILLEYITEHIGAGNKFCFLNSEGDYAICNERAGTWDNGVWYSNYTYKWGRTKVTKWNGWPAVKTKLDTYDYDDDDYYCYGWGNSTEYGYGKVKKATAYAYLTPEEITYLMKDETLYDDLADMIETYTDAQIREKGREPYVHLLMGILVSADAVEKQFNKTRFVLLKDYDEALHEVWETYYDIAIENLALDGDDDTSKDSPAFAECSVCHKTFTKEEALDDDSIESGLCPDCGGNLIVSIGSIGVA